LGPQRLPFRLLRAESASRCFKGQDSRQARVPRSGIDDDERTAIDPAGAEAQKGGDSILLLDGDGGASAASMSQFDA
jgi:hypothetical protein